MANENNSNTSALTKLIIVGLFFSTGYLMLFINSDKYHDLISQEVQANYDLMGEKHGANAKNRADKLYTLLVIDSGLQDRFLYGLVSAEEGESVIVDMTSSADRFILRFVNNIRSFIFQASYRISNLISWMYIFVPFLVFQIADGFYGWKIKQYSFGQTEQKKYTAWKSLTKWKLIGLLCYILIPAFYNASIALLSPIAIFLVAFTTNKTMRHYQKISG